MPIDCLADRRCIILVALVFDFLNGFHDAANSIATVVSTRVLSPAQGGGLGRLLQLRRRLRLRHARRQDHRQGHGRPRRSSRRDVDPRRRCSGAIVWNLITWYSACPPPPPTPSSAGYAGAAVAKAGSGRHHRRPAGPRPCSSSCSRRSSGWSSASRLMAVDHLAPATLATRPASTSCSAGCSSSPPRSTASATAATTPRRRWASSPGSWWPSGHLQSVRRPALGRARLPRRHRPRHAVRRLADREDHGHARSPSCSPFGGFCAETAGALTLCRRHARRASRSRPPTRSPARSSGWARRGGSPRCSGAWPGASSGPGC